MVVVSSSVTARARRTITDPAPTVSRQSGFTLLEVFVAFIIAAFALALLYEGGLSGLTNANTALRYEQAISRAQSHLAAASLAGQLQAGDRQGDEGGGYHWRVRVMPVARAASDDPSRPVAELFDIAVSLSWRVGKDAREVVLQTQRVGVAPPPEP